MKQFGNVGHVEYPWGRYTPFLSGLNHYDSISRRFRSYFVAKDMNSANRIKGKVKKIRDLFSLDRMKKFEFN